MSKTYIPKLLRRQIEAEAQYRCGYCQTQESIVGMPFVPDHLVPEALGGLTVRDNLWLACRRCNDYKGDRISGIDTTTSSIVPLFNPRTQIWSEHFKWREKGVLIEGLTSCGRATVVALRLNNDYIVKSRRRWVSVGWHPPK